MKTKRENREECGVNSEVTCTRLSLQIGTCSVGYAVPCTALHVAYRITWHSLCLHWSMHMLAALCLHYPLWCPLSAACWGGSRAAVPACAVHCLISWPSLPQRALLPAEELPVGNWPMEAARGGGLWHISSHWQGKMQLLVPSSPVPTRLSKAVMGWEQHSAVCQPGTLSLTSEAWSV